MKKLILTTCIVLTVLLAGCTNKNEDMKSGEIVSYSNLPGQIELKDKDGNQYGFVIDESTELVWQDEKMYDELVEEAKAMISSGVIEYEYDEWELVGPGMYVFVESGEKSISKMHLSNDLIVDCYVARTITVIGLDETYKNPFTVTAGDT